MAWQPEDLQAAKPLAQQAFAININDDNNTEIFIPLPLHASVKLFNEDQKSSYFSENNTEFLEETGIIKNLKYNDEFLRPYMVSNCDYDIITGSDESTPPFKYGID